MRNFVLAALFAALSAGSFLQAETPARASLDFLWSGSWAYKGNLADRAELAIGFDKPGLLFRVQALDRRPTASPEDFLGKGKTAPATSVSGAAYHLPTGSRILYGPLAFSGLAARLRNPMLRGAPFPDAREKSSADLKTAASSTAVPAAYARFSSPRLGGEKSGGAFYLSGQAEGASGGDYFAPDFSAKNLSFTGGGEFFFLDTGFLRAEGLYAQGLAPPRAQSTWFSAEPALPARPWRLFGGGFLLSVPALGRFPAFALAADGALSETFAWGRGFFGSAAIRIGSRPWRVSLSADGLGARYTGPGASTGDAEIRFASRFEYFGKGASRFRIDAAVRAQENDDDASMDSFKKLAADADRYSLAASYAFPDLAAVRRKPLAMKAVSAKFSADNRDDDKKTCAAETSASFRFWEIVSASKIKLSWLNPAEKSRPETAAFSESLSYSGKCVQAAIAAGYAGTAGKEPTWDAALSAGVKLPPQKKLRGKLLDPSGSWLKAKVDSPKIPDKWNFTLSWVLKM